MYKLVFLLVFSVNVFADKDPPTTVSLKIKQLNNPYFVNNTLGLKKYYVPFAYEGKVQYDCELSTCDKIHYKISYYIDGNPKDKTSGTVHLEPYSNDSLTFNFTLKKANQTILCSTVNQGPRKNASDPSVEIYLHYIPPPPVFPVIQAPNVTRGKYFPENYTQIYYYNFTDGEDTKFECALNGNKSSYLIALYLENEKDRKYQKAKIVSRSFKLKKDNKFINCIGSDLTTGQRFFNKVYLNYNPASIDTLKLNITGLEILQKGDVLSPNSTQIYNYTFSDGQKIKLSCNARGAKTHYDLIFYLDGKEVTNSKQVTFIEGYFELRKENKNIITCKALDATQHPLSTREVQFQYSPHENYVTDPSVVDLSITGLPDSSCNKTIESNKVTKHCTYTFDYSAVGNTIPLSCNLTKIANANYSMSYGNQSTLALKSETVTTLPNEITLKDKDETIVCTAARREASGFQFCVFVHLNYIPPPPTSSATEQTTTVTDKPTTIQGPSPSVLESKSSASVAGNESLWWLKFALGGIAVAIAICVLLCVIWFYRKKKPMPEDLTYANLTKYQKDYATLPVPAPRSLQKDIKPKITVEGTYSEPKDSQVIIEALYADPNRFKGSETYAEPYIKSGSIPCTYAEPNKADYAEPYMTKEGNYAAIGNSEGGYATIGNSEGAYAAIGNSEGGYAAIGNSEGGYAAVGNSEGGYAAIGNSGGGYAAIGNSEGGYAEIGVNNNDNKELYARPIPKAQRPFKTKDESDYSNVFKDLYANTNKKT